MTNSLVGVLLRFRQGNVGLAADVEAMFHQVRVRKQDQDALRFLWWTDDYGDPPDVYVKVTVRTVKVKTKDCLRAADSEAVPIGERP